MLLRGINVGGRVSWAIAPSRFPSALDRLAPCPVTARNWRTATRILALLEAR